MKLFISESADSFKQIQQKVRYMITYLTFFCTKSKIALQKVILEYIFCQKQRRIFSNLLVK